MRLFAWQHRPHPAPTNPVCRLRPLAARPAREWSMGEADRSLEEPARRRAAPGAADRSPSAADPERAGALHPLVLSPELSEAVRALGRREGVTPFMTLLAAFQLLLGRWSGQDDFAVGSPVANRTQAETERLDRLLREHARAPCRPLRQSDRARIPGPRARGGTRGIREPGDPAGGPHPRNSAPGVMSAVLRCSR